MSDLKDISEADPSVLLTCRQCLDLDRDVDVAQPPNEFSGVLSDATFLDMSATCVTRAAVDAASGSFGDLAATFAAAATEAESLHAAPPPALGKDPVLPMTGPQRSAVPPIDDLLIGDL